MLFPTRNLFLFCIYVMFLVTARAVKFEDEDNGSSSAAKTRFGPFDDSDSIIVEAAGTPGDSDSRFFGLGGGGGGLLGGLLGGKPYGGYGGYRPIIGGGPGAGYPPSFGVGPGVGYPPIGGGPGIGYPPGLGGGYPPIAGGIKPGRCPGFLGLGIGQPQTYPGGYGGYGGGLFGFRSADQGGEAGTEEAVSSRRRRDENAVTTGDSAAPQGRALPDGSDGSVNNDARFLGGIFGQTCFYDYHCPGQYKCCASGLLGKKATCQQPAIFG